MAVKIYNKLVRDKIPEIIEADGKTCKTEILSDEEYLKMLFLLQNEQKKYYRTMSAMEIRMIELGNTDFRLKNYIYGAQSRAAFKIGTIPHSYEKTCSYHYG